MSNKLPRGAFELFSGNQTNASTARPADVAENKQKNHRRLMPSAAQLFMGQFKSKNSPPVSVTCFTEKPKPPPSCGSSCSLNCDLRSVPPTNPDIDVTVEDVNSDAESDTTDSGTAATNSSVEDARDAFEIFLEPEDPPIASKRLKSSVTGGTLSLTEKENLNGSKTSRQKSDAASLKKYAYGKQVYNLRNINNS
jgi:hypothetical protein